MKIVRFLIACVLAFMVGVMATTVTSAESPPKKLPVCVVQEIKVEPEFKSVAVGPIRTTNQAFRQKDQAFTFKNKVEPNPQRINFVQLE